MKIMAKFMKAHSKKMSVTALAFSTILMVKSSMVPGRLARSTVEENINGLTATHMLSITTKETNKIAEA